MHAHSLCHKWLSNVLKDMHKSRLSALCSVVNASLTGGRLSVTGLGRSIENSVNAKHNIKKADRLVSNKHLQDSLVEIYKSIALDIVGKNKTPIVLVDWSDVDPRRKYILLRASVSASGRSLTLYEEVHDWSGKEKRSTHNRFLEVLKDILPKDCVPIIVTDAGFKVPWLKKVEALGWDFVGRVRGATLVSINNHWIKANSLHPKATKVAKILPDSVLAKSNTLECSLVLYKSLAKGRKRRGRKGEVLKSRKSQVNSKKGREPWLLATSLSSASKAVKVYSKRMEIEESFRDLKCSRFGVGLCNNLTYKLPRLRVLVLIGSLAATLAYKLGTIIRDKGLHKQFQANTVYKTPVLSNFFLGVQAIRQGNLRIPWKNFNFAAQGLG